MCTCGLLAPRPYSRPGRKEVTTSRTIYVAFALATTLFVMSGAFAEPNKEQYELQERCGIRAEEAFKSDYAGGGVTNTDEGQNMTSYQNHYSTRLNKCFILIIVTSVNYKKQPQYISTLITLFDLNEKAYAVVPGRPICGILGPRLRHGPARGGLQ